MSTPLDALAAAVDTARALWPAGETVDGVEAGRLVALNDALGNVRRLTEAAAVKVAAEISRQSRPELGADSLAKQQGFRNAQTLLAATLGTTTGEAVRLVKVGDATAPRVLLTGEKAPAKYPHVAAALSRGVLGKDAAAVIIGMLDRVALTAGRAAVEEAEMTLAQQAAGLTLDALQKVVARAEAYLDPDGVAPREEELRAKEHLRLREDREGGLQLSGYFGPESAAAIRAAIDGFVTAALAAQHNGRPEPAGPGRAATSDAAGNDSAVACDAPTRDTPAADDLLADELIDSGRRSIPQLQADALAAICTHLLGCENKDVPLQGATIVVRVALEDLEAGTGFGSIDGATAPVSIGTVRRMAADAGVIPCVLGGESEVLDWGRQKRLFTRAQRLALVERDGGCAVCGAPPGHTKVHHLAWWKRDTGPTDLNNGILLCTSCHHRVHDNGWTIRIDGVGANAKVWFIPPPWIDQDQTPRLGGRRRYDYVPAA